MLAYQHHPVRQNLVDDAAVRPHAPANGLARARNKWDMPPERRRSGQGAPLGRARTLGLVAEKIEEFPNAYTSRSSAAVSTSLSSAIRSRSRRVASTASAVSRSNAAYNPPPKLRRADRRQREERRHRRHELDLDIVEDCDQRAAVAERMFASRATSFRRGMMFVTAAKE